MFAYCFRVRRGFFAVFAPLCILSLMGCQNYIFRSFDLDGGDSLSVDAKQRLVFVTERGGKRGDKRVVCAEPSPDALSAIATAGSAAIAFPQVLPGGQTGQASGKGGFTQNEAAGSIGLRTQAIQLLRDSLYRACEAYMNGVIDRAEYSFILMNIDRVMISIVGIDAIGGTPVGPSLTLNATATAPTLPTTGSGGGGSEGDSGDAASDAGAPGGKSTTIQYRPGIDPKSAAQIKEIVRMNATHSSFPAVCMSLLSSGELNPNNPGHKSVIESCNYLLKGAVRKILSPHY
jgi:hypothetical protein